MKFEGICDIINRYHDKMKVKVKPHKEIDDLPAELERFYERQKDNANDICVLGSLKKCERKETGHLISLLTNDDIDPKWKNKVIN